MLSQGVNVSYQNQLQAFERVQTIGQPKASLYYSCSIILIIIVQGRNNFKF